MGSCHLSSLNPYRDTQQNCSTVHIWTGTSFSTDNYSDKSGKKLSESLYMYERNVYNMAFDPSMIRGENTKCVTRQFRIYFLPISLLNKLIL